MDFINVEENMDTEISLDELLQPYANPEKEEIYKKLIKIKREQKKALHDYVIIEISDRRHYCPIVYDDSKLNLRTGEPIILLGYNAEFDCPKFGSKEVDLNYAWGKSKTDGGFKQERKIIKEIFMEFPKATAKFNFVPPFVLGNVTKKGPTDQIPHRKLFEDIIGIHWNDIRDIERYKLLIHEMINGKYLAAYFARFYCKQNNNSNFIGPIGIGPTSDKNMDITSKPYYYL